MKIQAVKNYTTTGNYQTDNSKQRQPMPNQQSFGKVIFDERGMGKMTNSFSTLVKKVFFSVNDNLGDGVKSAKQEIWVHPFQLTHEESGIKIIHVRNNGEICETEVHFKRTDLVDIIRKAVVNRINQAFNSASALDRSSGQNNRWNIKLPLPEPALKERFPFAA